MIAIFRARGRKVEATVRALALTAREAPSTKGLDLQTSSHPRRKRMKRFRKLRYTRDRMVRNGSSNRYCHLANSFSTLESPPPWGEVSEVALYFNSVSLICSNKKSNSN